LAQITDRIDHITRIPPDYLKAKLPAPKSVKIEISPRCNYRCGFCALRTREVQPKWDMDFNLFKRVTREMREAVMARAKEADVFVSVAAVADYRPVDSKPHKIKRGNGSLTLELEPNPDILGEVAALPKGPFCVGFAAETEDLVANAKAKRGKKGIPLLAANLAQETFGKDTNALTLFDGDGMHELPRAPKIVLARQLVAHIAKMQLAEVECQNDMQLQVEHVTDLNNCDQVLFVDADMSCAEPFEFSRIVAARDDSYTSHAMSPLRRPLTNTTSPAIAAS